MKFHDTVTLGRLTDDSVFAVSAVKTSGDVFDSLTHGFISSVTQFAGNSCR